MLFDAPNQWNYIGSNIDGIQPTAVTWGSVVTPATGGAFGSWASLLGALPTEVFGILICINGNNASSSTRNALVDIGIDTSGGTSFTTVIPYLIGGHAGNVNSSAGGMYYYFPLYIPSGASVGVRATGTTTISFYVAATVFGKPSKPDAVNCGRKVVAFGPDVATATGTTFTSGTTSDGGWTQLGSALDTPLWWWQIGMTMVDTAMNAGAYALDLAAGDATNKRTILQNVIVSTNNSEQMTNLTALGGGVNAVAAGDLIYGRAQNSFAPDSALSMMAWGLG